MTDHLSELVERARSSRAERLDREGSASESLSQRVSVRLEQLLVKRGDAVRLAGSIVGISPDDLGFISCMIDGLTPEEAGEELGVSPASFAIAQRRIMDALNRHNLMVHSHEVMAARRRRQHSV